LQQIMTTGIVLTVAYVKVRVLTVAYVMDRVLSVATVPEAEVTEAD